VTEPEGSVYVYGVLSATDRLPDAVTGVAGSEVRTIEDGELAAVVSDLDAGSLMVARELRAHWSVLERLSRDATVLPVRFGTVMEDDDAVRERLLGDGAEELRLRLRELADRVQLTVKGDYDQEALLRAVVRTSPEIARLRERLRALPEAAGYYEQIRLGELVAGEIARHRETDTDFVLERLGPLSVATRVEHAGGADPAMHVAFLVARDGVASFDAQLASVAEALAGRIRLRCVGPLPPYSFVDTESTAWA
jgi:hypothetical protein